MKVGDLVRDNSPRAWANAGYHGGGFRCGVVIKNVGHNRGIGCTNKVFNVLWANGAIGNSIWDYELKLVAED